VPDSSLVGQTIAHYRVTGTLGEGGMGHVYRAVDLRLGREVALKMLRPDLAGDQRGQRRFLQEAVAASALNHPHIVTVYELDRAETNEGPLDFIAMEYVQGGSLATRLARGLTIDEALSHAADVADALAAAHTAGIVHRDIKPANVMLTTTGRAKVVDFGLAKHARRSDDATGVTIQLTESGTTLGTISYMAPEQAEGRAVDGRADVFAFGVMLYEMLSGERPFDHESQVATLAAILKADCQPLAERRPDVPSDLARIVTRCLARDPDARYQSALDLRRDLQAVTDLRRARGADVRRRADWRILAPLGTTTVVAIGALLWIWQQGARESAARDLIPAVEQRVADQDYLPAYASTAEIAAALGEDPQVARLWSQVSMQVTIHSTPVARLSMRSYSGGSEEWRPLGQTPIAGVRVPLGHVRFRLEADGYETLEWTSAILAPELTFTLSPLSGPRSGFVRVPGGSFRMGAMAPVDLDSYWIARHEVTNREFKRFVDAGGYERADVWPTPVMDGARRLEWKDAMDRFRDRTGRHGPSTWELGTYADGRDDLPVAGVSWYEAAAFAAFAGKSLPTVYHWMKAAGLGPNTGFFSDIVARSNFGADGVVAVETRGAVTPYGAYDMAGNVKEWCANESTGGHRLILGGGWGEPAYMFRDVDAHPPLQRDATFGIRLVEYERKPGAGIMAAVAGFERDLGTERPVSDEVYGAYAALYRAPARPLVPEHHATDDPSPHFRRERVSFAAAYATTRVPAWLFLPPHVSPPYQTLVYWPSGESLELDSSELVHRDWRLQFVIRSGRAILHPVYAGTYERRRDRATAGVPGSLTIQRAQDVVRAVDYLETRSDVDAARIAFYGASLGASFSPIFLALEPRFKAAVLLWGGLRDATVPVADPLHFAPRVTKPVLMVNGRHDFIFPVNGAQASLLRLLGTPEADKRHVLFDYGHIPPKNDETIKEVLDWLDRYLGPVTRRSRD
jgi:predicted Ser/Thr protein kinase/predicted esterase